MVRLLFTALVVLGCALPAQAQGKKAGGKIPPTAAAVKYGSHERQVLDFWQAKSDKPTPVVFCIHGGGWQNGDKGSYANGVKQYLDAGISVVAINYRYAKQGLDQKVVPPVKAPLEDAARALQFVRSKAKEWNIDKKRIGATGGSAGACSSLWLAFHSDMADPKSSDPVARESTRLYCAAVSGAQVSLDPKELREWIPNYGYGAHAFGLKNFQDLYDHRDQVIKEMWKPIPGKDKKPVKWEAIAIPDNKASVRQWIKEYSPIEHVTKDDPAIFLEYPNPKNGKPVLGAKQVDATHSAIMGLKLVEKLKSVGVEAILVYPGAPHPMYKNSAAFLIDRLRK